MRPTFLYRGVFRFTYRLPRSLQLRLVANRYDAIDWPWPTFRSAFPFDQEREA